jgi:hypothetical protein
MHEYKFDIFPRYVGDPYQKYVTNYEDFYSFLYSHNGIAPLYTTHNPIDGNIKYVQQFFDLDTDFGATLEEARQDTIKLYKYFENYDKVMSFSSQGFHFDLRFDGKYDTVYQLSHSIKAFQESLINRLSLKSINIICAEPRHLQRVPGTLRASGSPELRKRHCIPLDISTLEKPLEHIIEYSIRNKWTVEDNKDKELYPLESILLNDFATQVEVPEESINIDFTTLSDVQFNQYVKMILEDPLYTRIFSTHPSHMSRVMSAIKFKSFGLSLDAAIVVFDRIADTAKWDDRENTRLRNYQIKYIYNKPLSLLQRR